MKTLVMVVALAGALGCGAVASCKCSDGQVCAFEGATSRCATPCPADGGSCGSGLSCQCASSCSGCKDCLSICK